MFAFGKEKLEMMYGINSEDLMGLALVLQLQITSLSCALLLICKYIICMYLVLKKHYLNASCSLAFYKVFHQRHTSGALLQQM